MKKIFAILGIFMLVALLFSVMPVNAESGTQDPYMLYGIVYDTNGDEVAGAVVTMKNERTKEEVSVLTDTNGKFLVNVLAFDDGYDNNDNILLTAEKGGESGSVRIAVVEGEMGDETDLTFGVYATISDDDDDRADDYTAWIYLSVLVLMVIATILGYLIYTKQFNWFQK